MNRLARILIPVLSLMLGTGCFSQGFHTPGEMLHFMAEADLHYELLVATREFDPIAPGTLAPHAIYQVNRKGEIRLDEYELDEEGQADYFLGLAALEAGSYEPAREHFKTVLLTNYDYSPALSAIGEAYLLEGGLTEAREWLTRAIGANFYNYHAHQTLAEVYHLEEKSEEALTEIAIAWVLNRNDRGMQDRVAGMFDQHKLKFQAWTFQPEMRFFKRSDTILVVTSELWMAYAVCKSFWNYDPVYRMAMTGDEQGPSIFEEQECLFNLISVNTNSKGKEKSSDPVIRELIRAKNEQLINEFIFFEIWMFQEPLIAYTQPREVIEGLAEYVIRMRGK